MIPYQEAIGRVEYLTTETLPGLAFSVGKLSHFCDSRTQEHWTPVKHMRYVRVALQLGACFSRSERFPPHGFSDSQWAGDFRDRKSIIAHVFKRGVEQSAGALGNKQL